MDNVVKRLLRKSSEDHLPILNRLVEEADSLGNRLLSLSRKVEDLKKQWEAAHRAGDSDRVAQIEKNISNLWVTSIQQMEGPFDRLHDLL